MAAPKIRRPPERTSTLARSFATGMGDRYGRITTLVPSEIRRVTPASQGSTASGSNMWSR
jgi:hypothetical protein